jgi:glutaredoxin
VKELLSRAGVPFEVRNVETDLAAYQELMDRGFRTVPVTFIGEGDAAPGIRGFDESALKRALGV